MIGKTVCVVTGVTAKGSWRGSQGLDAEKAGRPTGDEAYGVCRGDLHG